MDFAALSTKYQGDVASAYVSKRTGRKWFAEEQAAEELLKDVPKGARTLDIPVGTGRLIALLHSRGFDAYGVDASDDMLAEARACARKLGAKIQLGRGDIRNIDFPADHFDLVTCLRFLNWIDAAGVEQALSELVRVSRGKLLVGIRYLAPFGELGRSRNDLIRRLMRCIGFPRLRAKRWGLVYHDQSLVTDLFKEFGLGVVASRHVERRLDGTDYVFFLVQKS